MHPRRRWYKTVAVAASILLVLGTAGYFFFGSNGREALPVAATAEKRFKNDVSPGMTGAILTLEDGRKIILDTVSKGRLFKGVERTEDGIAYQKGNIITAYNTLSTPKGRQFSIVLADGTKVWLNAASSITYPTAFTNKEKSKHYWRSLLRSST